MHSRTWSVVWFLYFTLAALSFSVVVFAHCAQRPGTPETFQVEKIFTTAEGCSVYRFYDAGRFQFIASCGCKK